MVCDVPPKFFSKFDFSFRIDDSILGEHEAQVMYNDMRTLTKDCRSRAMILCLKAAKLEYEKLEEEIKTISRGMSSDTGGDFEASRMFTNKTFADTLLGSSAIGESCVDYRQ